LGQKARIDELERKASVSIPQSEFCPLGPAGLLPIIIRSHSFNSSVGILSVGTYRRPGGGGPLVSQPQFQFLSRNSVRWDTGAIIAVGRAIKVSIPQSEFCPLGLLEPWKWLGRENLSFQFLSRNSVRWDPSVSLPIVSSFPRFQFLSRNSVRWDAIAKKAFRNATAEFQFLSRNSVRWDCCLSCVRWKSFLKFQFLSRNSVRWDI